MSFLTPVTRFAGRTLSTVTSRSFLTRAAYMGEHVGAAYAAGYINTRYGEQAKFRGMEMTALAGAMGGLASLFGYGRGFEPHLTNLSLGLLSAHAAAYGARQGAEKAGRRLALVAPGTKDARFLGDQQYIGEIPPAPQPGKYLDLNEISRVAAMHGG